MPLVSVLMPSYNHERYVAESIESVLNQTCGDLELIIVDDASTDSSREIIERYRTIDSRIKTIFHKKNMGIARTVNDGLESATGKYVAFTASDDAWFVEKLEVQLGVLENHENNVVWGEGTLIDAEGKSTGETLTQKFNAANRGKSGNIFHELIKGNIGYGPARILKRKSIGSIRFNENLKYLNDYQFEIDLASKYNYYFIERPLVKYRIHGENTIFRYNVFYFDCKDTIELNKHILKTYAHMLSKKDRDIVCGKIAPNYFRLMKSGIMLNLYRMLPCDIFKPKS